MSAEALVAAEWRIRDWFALNLLLQLFDGLATYEGLALGFSEANPLVAASIAALGAGPALLLFKAKACALLLLVRRVAHPRLGERALRAVAIAYTLCSVAPWLGHLLPLAASLSR